VALPGLPEQHVRGTPSVSVPGECLALDDTLHPANRRLYLARAVKHFIRGFGIAWDAPALRNNGRFAPFAWTGEA
jgi:hypothetical protein